MVTATAVDLNIKNHQYSISTDTPQTKPQTQGKTKKTTKNLGKGRRGGEEFFSA